MTLHFTKMDGLGNDFVIIDARVQDITLSQSRIVELAARTHPDTKGCDQLIVLRKSNQADIFMQIYNADGSEVDACGNATRAVGFLLHQEGIDMPTIATEAGRLLVLSVHGNEVIVDMGPPRLDWHEIPLAEEMDTLSLPITEGPLDYPVAVSMGNPHAVFFVQNAKAIDLLQHGPVLERHPLFPERANIGIAEIQSRDQIYLRVFERGVGETLACGTGACAALVAAVRRGLTERNARITLPGGTLQIAWQEADGHVHMQGAVQVQFKGEVDPVEA